MLPLVFQCTMTTATGARVVDTPTVSTQAEHAGFPIQIFGQRSLVGCNTLLTRTVRYGSALFVGPQKWIREARFLEFETFMVFFFLPLQELEELRSYYHEMFQQHPPLEEEAPA